MRALQVVLVVSALLAAALWSDRALAQAVERRVALVVGNGHYVNVPRLPNTGNDAQLIAKTLQGLGFALVGGKALIDLDRASFQKAIRSFSDQLTTASVGLFYYAGHGLQVQGVNYLVPIDANPSRSADVEFELIDAGLVLRVMESGGSKLNLMILDACRNNPFGGRGLREVAGGLAQMRAPKGTLISYATQPGNVASDGAGSQNSPYTSALADAMREPGLDLFEVFNQVGVIVDRATGSAQQPWVSASPIEGKFYFAALPPAPTASGIDKEALFWQSIKDSSNPADYEVYLRKFPGGVFADLAQEHLRALAPAAHPAASAPAAASPAPQQQAMIPLASPAPARGRYDGEWKGRAAGRASWLCTSEPGTVMLTVVHSGVSGQLKYSNGAVGFSGEVSADGSFEAKGPWGQLIGNFEEDHFRGNLIEVAPTACSFAVSLERVKG